MAQSFTTTAEDAGTRLDQFLQHNAKNLSRTKIRKIIDLGGVHVDKQRVRKCGFQVNPKQTIEVYQDKGSLEPYRIEQDAILYQDDYIIVLNKPAGIETQPTPARFKGTLYEALLHYLGHNTNQKKIQIGMAQRLDRDTSGAIVFSIHKDSHKHLSEQVKNHSINKEYLAFVQGIPEPAQGTYHSFLAYDRVSRRMQSTASGGKEAITHYRVAKKWQESALVSVRIITGRTHQIRAHFAENGHPLLGDTAYGGPGLLEGAKWHRQCLHAWKLTITHPQNGNQLSFTAPVPDDMAVARNFI